MNTPAEPVRMLVSDVKTVKVENSTAAARTGGCC